MASSRDSKTLIQSAKLPLLFAIIGGLGGCMMPAADVALSSGLVGGGSGTTVIPIPATIDGDVYLQVQSSWDLDSGLVINQGECHVDKGLATDPSVPVTASCLIRIPEGQLYYSKLLFTFGTTNTDVCKTVRYYPAYYQAGGAAGFKKYWSNTSAPAGFDCSAGNYDFGMPKKDCYFGAAPNLLSTFPLIDHFYFSTTNATFVTKTLASAFSFDLRNNTLTGTRMADSTTSMTAAAMTDPNFHNQYVANTMHPHVVECRDEHEQLRAKVTVDIADDDTLQAETPGAPSDDYWYDWNEIR